MRVGVRVLARDTALHSALTQQLCRMAYTMVTYLLHTQLEHTTVRELRAQLNQRLHQGTTRENW
jgi:hypothetical protein